MRHSETQSTTVGNVDRTYLGRTCECCIYVFRPQIHSETETVAIGNAVAATGAEVCWLSFKLETAGEFALGHVAESQNVCVCTQGTHLA